MSMQRPRVNQALINIIK